MGLSWLRHILSYPKHLMNAQGGISCSWNCQNKTKQNLQQSQLESWNKSRDIPRNPGKSYRNLQESFQKMLIESSRTCPLHPAACSNRLQIPRESPRIPEKSLESAASGKFPSEPPWRVEASLRIPKHPEKQPCKCLESGRESPS